MNLSTIKALICDMDGVLWRGDTALPGLIEFFDFLKQRDIPFTLATNNASKTVSQYQQKFAKFGVDLPAERIMTSSLATAFYLQDQLEPGSRLYVIGQDGLRQAVQEAGFTIAADDSQPVVAVVSGIDFHLTYEKLRHAAFLIQRGARFIGSNGDLTFPMENGFAPGTGSILAAIEAATQIKPTVIGKPNALMFEVAMRRMNSQPADTAMIGDRLETDILGGQRAGLKTILVETGVDSKDSIVTKGIEPDLVLSGIVEVVERWQQL